MTVKEKNLEVEVVHGCFRGVSDFILIKCVLKVVLQRLCDQASRELMSLFGELIEKESHDMTCPDVHYTCAL